MARALARHRHAEGFAFPPPALESAAAPALGLAMAAAVATLLYLGRGIIFSGDELSYVLRSPHLDLRHALEPYSGHLIVTTEYLYRAILETAGAGYLPFRGLAAATVLLTVGVFFVWASRRIPRAVALAPSIVLLVFGSDGLHVLQGNGFTFLFPLTCGIAALLALEREDRLGDVAACLLLLIGVITHSSGLPMLVGAGVLLALTPGGRRRLWLVALPAGVYVAWWLWARGHAISPRERPVVLHNVVLIPVWSFQSLATVMGSLTGLSYRFNGQPAPVDAGPALALLAIGGLVWRSRRRAPTPGFWAVLAALLAYWAVQTVAADGTGRFPGTSHYLYAGSLLVLLVGAEAIRGLHWSPGALAGLYAVAVCGVATNLALLAGAGNGIRAWTPVVRSALGGLQVAGRRAPPDYAFAPPVRVRRDLVDAFSGVLADRIPPTAAYLDAVRLYGPIGYSPQGLASRADPFARAVTDSVLASALGLRLSPAAAELPHGCRPAARTGKGVYVLAPGSDLVLSRARGPVVVGRFGPFPTVDVGAASPERTWVLAIPADGAPGRRWLVSARGGTARLCRLGA